MKNKIYFRLNQFKNDLIDWYYQFFHGIKIDLFNASIRPALGKGEFVSVYRKGSFIDIVNEQKSEFIRIIPCQYNHGVMVEFWEKDKIMARTHVDLRKFKELCHINCESNL